MRSMRRRLVMVVLFGWLLVSAVALAEPPQFTEAEELLADRKYAEALSVLQALQGKDPEGQDYLAFLIGNALFYQKQYDQAIAAYAGLIQTFPDSAWKQKALFKQAECYTALKQFDRAEKIYEQEVIRLVSPERKAQLAQVYLDFAEEYAQGDWVKRHDPQSLEKRPDFAKAKQFYELAFALELGMEQAETIQFQIARCAFELGDYAGAITAFQRLREQYPQGQHATAALYYLGECYLRQREMIQARKTLRDLMELHPDDAYAPDAAFLLSRTYHIPTPGSPDELELGVKALHDFLEIYPDDARAVQAEYEIGLSYYQFARYEDAIAAFTTYLKKYEHAQATSGNTSPATAEKSLPASGQPKPLALQETLPLVRYYLGFVYQQQRKYETAIAVWQEYLQKYPSHQQWTEVQRQMIEAEYLIADRLFHEKQYDEARAAWEQFLAAHPLDQRNPEIMFRLGEIFVLQAEEKKTAARELYQQAIAQWTRTVSKYPGTEPASQAQYRIGSLLEAKLLKFEEALDAYQHVTWGSYAAAAQQQIQTMQAKQLALLTERVFRTNETPQLKLTTRNLETLTFRMYKVDLETYFRKMQTTAGVDQLDIALIDPDQTWDVPIQEYQKYREFETAVPLPFTAPGAYLVTCSAENLAEGGGYEATTLVLISDVDVIVKTTKRDLLVFAQNMATGVTYPEVKLLVSDGQKIFAEGQTGRDGVWHVALKELQTTQDVRVFAYASTNYAATTLTTDDLQYVAGLESRGYLYTDRPVYRPGQQVNIRGILREVDEHGVLQVPNIKRSASLRLAEEADQKSAFPQTNEKGYQLQVRNRQGHIVYQGDVMLNDFGSFAVDFPLSSRAPTGKYQIVVKHGNQTYFGQFLVGQYKLEPIKLTIDTERDVYFRGETITGTITAEYYYGEPVKEKKVTYALAGIEEFSATTDTQGKITFRMDTRNFTESQAITLTARLDDENVQTGKIVWLAMRGFTCAVSTIRPVYLVDEDIEVNIQTEDLSGKPLAQQLTLKVLKRETTPYGDNAEVQIETQPLTTAADGRAKTILRLSAGGTYVLRAEGLDRFGNPVAGQNQLTISDENDAIKLRLMTDREEFTVGATPDVTLFSRASKGLGLLTYEAESILSYQILTIQPDKNPLKLAITSAHAPNFTLAVAQMEGNRLHVAQKEFTVVQGLNITLTPQVANRPEHSSELPAYRPGDTITIDISTTDHNGQPVPAEISLAMVDEALYAQYEDPISPIREYFYAQRRELAAKIRSSCTFQFQAETRAIQEELIEEARRREEEQDKDLTVKEEMVGGEGLVAKTRSAMAQLADVMPAPATTGRMTASGIAGPSPFEPEQAVLTGLRSYFPETGYWNPRIVTDLHGKATITVKLPDSTTTWRLTSRGITQETLVGEATAGLITKLPFFADIKTPQVFTEGDQATLLASVHNYSGRSQAVQTTFSANLEKTVLERQTKTMQAENQSVMETDLRLDLSRLSDVSALTPLSVEFAAKADTLQDRLKREVALRPWGIEYVTTQSGTVQDDRSVQIALPGDQSYVHREMSLLLNPALDRTVVDLVNDVPWLCKAPASSAIHEAQVVFNALTFLKNHPLPPPNLGGEQGGAELRQLQSRFSALLTDITLRQNPDGGWNWTGMGDRSDVFVSADAVLIFSEAKRQGFPVQTEVWQKGIEYLKVQFQAAQENEVKAYLLYTLAMAGDVDFAHVNRVYRERNTLKSAGLSLLILTCAEMNRPEIAAELLPLLLNRAQRQADTVTGQHTVFWPTDALYPWLQNEVETTAFALLAIQKTDPKQAIIAEGVMWLYKQRQWLGWGSMRTNARVSSALLEYITHTQTATQRYVLEVAVNDTPIRTLTVDGVQGAAVLHIPAGILKDRGNTVRFTFDGRGALNYVCVLKGTSREVRKTQNQYEVWRYYEPAPLVFKGKEMPRGFSVLDGSYSTWQNALTQVPLGGFGRVTLQYQQRAYDYNDSYRNPWLILEEPLPAGCTVLEQSLHGDFQDYDIRDGKIVFYLNNAQYGRISYDLYGYLPGNYRVLPTKIQSAYQPALLDYGEPYQITVLGRGQAVTETYRKTPDELYSYGKALFEAKQYADARPLLRELFDKYRLRAEPYKDTAKMLLYIAIADNNAREIVQFFEILKEKYPDLVLTFDEIITVGQAYRDIGEFERATQVFKATAEASFLKDVQVSGALEAQGEFAAAVAHTQHMLAEYPDVPTIETTFYALAQLLYTESSRQSAESSRQSAESSRQSAESSRQSAESSRQSAESSRQSAESSRQSAESSRQSAESSRQSAESSRQSAESSRQSAESSRQSAESSRQSAESSRQQAGGSGQEISAEILLQQAIAMLRQFLVLYPEQPIADEVSFSLANAYFDLEDFARVIQAAQRFQQRYPKSQYLSGYQYIEGYAHFEAEHYEDALRLCRTVATGQYPDKQGRLGKSPHKNLALYIMGQIYHAMGQPEQAVAEYTKVQDLFSDAKEALHYLTRKWIVLDEVTTFPPKAAAQVNIHARNVNEVNIVVYRVDLMKLYLLQKNLNAITQVNLAGITPYFQQKLALKVDNLYVEHEESVPLPLDKEGAYLVVAKAAEVDASGMVLMNTLKLDVEEDAVSGRVRVNVLNTDTGRYENNVHVKVIGSADTQFVSGDTDLRGLFIADNIHGAATVIVRKGDQYAFYRGTTALQPVPITVEMPRQEAGDMRSQAMQQLRDDNVAIQQQNEIFLRQNLYQNKQTGVEVQRAY